ncbi:MAG: hypothetical protein HXO58_07830 [Rothia mucilaginosa]|uniref:Uncharacterized protein n=1 Tax=Rothia mucilaginosa TaxID=43675 RepID=A0A930L978_9MICC|nr:hypothetical protein [Rothia mucilaginosa]MBF1659728.1 hypothetical protein [Rothia mucilaginosa]
MLEEQFVNYMTAQREFYASPKAREEFLQRAIAKRTAMLERGLNIENEKLREILTNHQQRDLDMLEKQAVDGAHRWDQAKLASKIANDRNENALERGIFSEAAYSEEELAQVDIRHWDRACPEGEVILKNFGDKLHHSDSSDAWRELTITREVRIETPTGERVHLDIEARIVQKNKNSSSYTVEYVVKQDGKTLGILIPNSSTQDSYFNVGAVYENRPLTREPWMALHKGIRLRKSDWDHYAKVNNLSAEELEEIKAEFTRTQKLLSDAGDAKETEMFSRLNAFQEKINRKHRGHRHNNATEQFVEEHGARTSFNSIAGAKENIAQTMNSLDSTLLEMAVKARTQGINTYAKEQFGVTTKRDRDRVEKESREIMANEPERLQPKSRSEKRNRGGGRDRVERNMAREKRRASYMGDSPVVVARREEKINRTNTNMEVLQKRGGLFYSARVNPVRQLNEPDNPFKGYSYRVVTTQAGGRKSWVSMKFTKDGVLTGGLKAYRHPNKEGMVMVCKGPRKEVVAIVSTDQFDAMADVEK